MNGGKSLVLKGRGSLNLFPVAIDIGEYDICSLVVHLHSYMLPMNEGMLLYSSQSLILPWRNAEKDLV